MNLDVPSACQFPVPLVHRGDITEVAFHSQLLFISMAYQMAVRPITTGSKGQRKSKFLSLLDGLSLDSTHQRI